MAEIDDLSFETDDVVAAEGQEVRAPKDVAGPRWGDGGRVDQAWFAERAGPVVGFA